MRNSSLQFLEAIAGLGVGIVATLSLELALHPVAARELTRRADHVCRAGDSSRAPYLHGDIVTLPAGRSCLRRI